MISVLIKIVIFFRGQGFSSGSVFIFEKICRIKEFLSGRRKTLISCQISKSLKMFLSSFLFKFFSRC